MKTPAKYPSLLFAACMLFCSSCSVIENSSRHGFESGYYNMKSPQDTTRSVYLDIADREVTVYPKNENGLGNSLLKISLLDSDSLCRYPFHFQKASLDIDLTTIPLKIRPAVSNIPIQMNVDFNAALYAGWRRDKYTIRGRLNPLNKCNYSVVNRGYDFGIFTGLSSTAVNPFTTNNTVSIEYNGMVIQYGVAGFLESNIASFGIATGYDYLLGPDRNAWVYNNKPWIGFIIGIALN